MRKFFCFNILICILFVLACTPNKRNEELLAQVGEKKLYLSDITDILSSELTPEDSIDVLNNYATRWVRNQLVLGQAENNLSKEKKDVSQELESYRASLLIFSYEQAYIEQRMDTLVSQAEIESFYNENSDIFKLTNVLIKGLYIKVSNDFPSLSKIRELYRSNKDKDFVDLERLCMQGAVTFDAFDNEWVDFSNLAKELPLEALSYENDLIRKRYLDVSDKVYTYFLSVKDIKMKGGVAPMEHVTYQIKTIILNRRKKDMINLLEEKIYKDALKNNDFKININK